MQFFPETPESSANLGFDLELDTRDRSFLPDRGFHLRLNMKRVFAAPDYYHLFAMWSQFIPLNQDWSLAVDGTWAYVSTTAPGYDFLYVGGAGHFSVGAVPFPGLSRDYLRVTRMAAAGILIRRRFRETPFEALRDMAVAVFYQAGLFNEEPALSGFEEKIHGYGLGVYLDRRFPGPMRLEITRSNRNPFSVRGAVGYAF